MPEEMFVPVEAFDALPALQNVTANGLAKSLPLKGAGSFEIILQMIPSERQKAEGSISPTTMKSIRYCYLQ